MNENIKKFLEKVEQSPELQAQFAQISDPEEAYKLASTIQDGFTKDEFIAEMKKSYEETIQDLSDEDIAKIAGGVSPTSKAVALITGGLSAVGGAILSAAAAGVKVSAAASAAAAL